MIGLQLLILSVLCVVFVVHCETEEFIPSALLEAASRKDIEGVRRALEQGENIDVLNSNGWSSARFAVEGNDMDLLRELIDAGIDLNNPDEKGITPLMAAAATGDKEMVEILLAGNAAPLQVADDGTNAYQLATQSGRQLVAHMILEAATLHAVDGDRLDDALEALRLGGYVNLHNRAGWTPLMLAAVHGNVDAVKEIIELGAQLTRTENDGWTALHFAAAQGHDGVVEVLLQHNADAAQTTVDGRTARDLAVSEGHQIVADMLPQ